MQGSLPASNARLADSDGCPPELLIVENAALEGMLFNRNLVGIEFSQLCLEASGHFLCHIVDELDDAAQTAELVILSKGLTYRIGEAYAGVTGVSLPMNLIATRRAEVHGDVVSIDAMYERLDAGGSTLIIGDTVASGATVVAALEAYQRRSEVRRLYVFSFAGSRVGAQRIGDYCRRRSIRLTMLFGLAAFGLADNGFDLSFLDPDTHTRAEYREMARVQFDGRPVSAVGWDFGSQVMAPTKYRELCWLEAEKWGLHGHPSLALEKEPTDMNLLRGESAAFGV